MDFKVFVILLEIVPTYVKTLIRFFNISVDFSSDVFIFTF